MSLEPGEEEERGKRAGKRKRVGQRPGNKSSAALKLRRPRERERKRARERRHLLLNAPT